MAKLMSFVGRMRGREGRKMVFVVEGVDAVVDMVVGMDCASKRELSIEVCFRDV